MCHKFALFDGRLLLNGRFNWTRSAATDSEEVLLVIDHPALLPTTVGCLISGGRAMPIMDCAA
jgi:phosphatidylserine/phosphatidylglycerophosphate/cardiolipin synthase-like enzyme